MLTRTQQYFYDFCTCCGDAQNYLGVLRLIEDETKQDPYNERGAILAKLVQDIGYGVRPADSVLAQIIKDNIKLFNTSYHKSLMEEDKVEEDERE